MAPAVTSPCGVASHGEIGITNVANPAPISVASEGGHVSSICEQRQRPNEPPGNPLPPPPRSLN